MSIESYIHLIVETPFPIFFIFFIIMCEYVVAKLKKNAFSFSAVFTNFSVLFLGVSLYSLFTYFVIQRETVVGFASSHALFSTPVSWGIFFIWLVVFDFINYWTHVLYHKSNFFWMFHSVHHSDKNLAASTTVRVSFTTSFFTITSYALMTFMGVNSLLLPALAQTMFLQQTIVHSSLLRGFFPTFISLIFVTPDTHAIHHSEKHSDKNYGFLFTLWDSIFGTLHNQNHNDESFGIKDFAHTSNPFKIHLEPIISFIKRK